MTKLPVALSACNKANSEPVAGEICCTCPCSFRWFSASTVKLTGWPMRTLAICVSFMLAITHRVSGTSAISCAPELT
ncbi:hypothetical protein D3C77_718620 [compost metagenome]